MDNEISFEEALKQLEEIVNNLESGELSLDESLSKFEEGIRLSRFCNRKLTETQMKVQKLIEKNGEIKIEPLEDE